MSEQHDIPAALTPCADIAGEPVSAGVSAPADAPYPNLPPALRKNLWQKGKSGNPTGKRKYPKKGDALDAARDFADRAVRELWKMSVNPKVPAETRRKALNDLIDRGYGKVSRTLKLEPPPGALGPAPQDALAQEMEAALAGAQQERRDTPPQPGRQEVLPPLTVDPFAVPEDLNRPRRAADAPPTGFARPGANPALRGDSLRTENAGLRAENATLSADSQRDKNLKTAFDMGVAVGQAMGDDDD